MISSSDTPVAVFMAKHSSALCEVRKHRVHFTVDLLFFVELLGHSCFRCPGLLQLKHTNPEGKVGPFRNPRRLGRRSESNTVRRPGRLETSEGPDS